MQIDAFDWGSIKQMIVLKQIGKIKENANFLIWINDAVQLKLKWGVGTRS
jgi:hypothetical protein